MKTNKITIMGISLISSAIILAGCKNSLPTSEGSESDETFTQNVSVTTVFSEKSNRYSGQSGSSCRRFSRTRRLASQRQRAVHH